MRNLLLACGAVLALSCSAGGSSDGKSGGNGAGGIGSGATAPGLGGSFSLPTGGTGPGLGPVPSSCADPKSTKLTGTVYSPAGNLPLYNVVVYVPVAGEAQPAITEGASCDKCAGSQARGWAVALTDEAGHFTLEGVPEGSDVPLVLQVGKWRREVKIPRVEPCTTTTVTDRELTRLPKNQSEGHLPKIAMVTGHSDALECLLRKLGIEDAEFTVEGGPGRVNMFHGCASKSGAFGANKLSPALGGGELTSAVTSLYASPQKLAAYDMLVLSCEGHGCDEQKTPENGATLKGFADAGGRILFDHMHFRWFVKAIEAWEGIGEFDTGDDFPPNTPFDVQTGFPKGAALAKWLVNVGASQTEGKLVIAKAQKSAKSAAAPIAQPWVQGTGAIQYMSVNTPVELAATPDDQCGRFIHTDLHVAGNSTSSSDQGTPFPGGCDSGELTPEEKALAFMIFDLSSCVMREDQAPQPPVVVK
ncbi:MAG: carboxypeptidase regulatory-like domain-containing protein [Myxococcales bacterium]|nr:MAG: carboxypeptidase regulatory-like domain-containing protein [Myxococcales bacterium]